MFVCVQLCDVRERGRVGGSLMWLEIKVKGLCNHFLFISFVFALLLPLSHPLSSPSPLSSPPLPSLPLPFFSPSPFLLGLSDTGRMLSALSDSYLHMMDHSLDFNMDADNSRRILSPEETLMPPLSMHDRHPSAPQLASMLASSVDNKMSSDNMAVTFEDVRD